MEAIGLLGMLGVCSLEDIKKRQIHIMVLLGFGILGMILHLFGRSLTIREILGGMIVGLVLFIISILSGEKIGKGDALLITMTGIYLGFWDNILLLWGASMLTGLTGLVLYLRKKRRAQIPFAPYVLGVYILILFFKGEGFVS